MPIYEYECEKCCYRFELKRRFNESPEANCPQCQSGARRIFSPLPIIFKGSGFYVTDKAAQERKAVNRRDGDGPSGGDKDAGPAGQDKKELVTAGKTDDKKEGEKADAL